VGIAIPVSEVQAGAWKAAGTMALGAVVSIALGVLIALFFARWIAAPIRSLAAAARALGAGTASVPIEARARVQEVDEVADALAASADAVLAREQSLIRADGELRAANRAKDEFLATLSHELRNPLAAISMSAEVLRHSLADPRLILRTADVLERQSAQMSRLVEDLLDMSRITFGKVTIDPRPMDLAHVVQRLAGAWRAAGRFAGHTVRFDLAPAWILGDSGRVEQVLANLLDNALKFTPREGQVAVRVAREGAAALLEVSDTGRGMPAALRDNAFDVFVQGEQSIDRPAGGLGIGLALVRRIAELHGGSAEVHSDGEGRGATFVVRFPAIEAVAPPEPLSASASRVAARRVLVVEDNEDARTLLCALLRAEGHTVSEASDAPSALAAIETSRPDAALVDIGLPGVSGYKLVGQLRERLGPGALLVALTGYGSDADRRRALEAGFDQHLVKPVDGERLRSVLGAAVFPGR
jgi:signal transduction histidine kinase